jgi:nucleoside 2-deoxyribosyltransferase
MPFDPKQQVQPCVLCGADSNRRSGERFEEAVNCSFCGEFRVTSGAQLGFDLPLTKPTQIALARYLLRKLQKQERRPVLDEAFFEGLEHRHLPSPAEACDNLLKWIAEAGDRRPGQHINRPWSDEAKISSEVGVVDREDLVWLLETIQQQRLLQLLVLNSEGFSGNLTADGWRRYEELQRAHIASNYAFFARQFQNEELDDVVEKCLRPAVEQTGFELRPVTQKAGLIDATIEDEIRRCKFLLADLSDDNGGAYWEAGFAEGLGKPVIYICHQKTPDGFEKKTHFDTDHRHTVRWDLSNLDGTARQLKAVIRNTLLGEAKQDD